eukprot:3957190-Prymnesium_polylepis.3
MIAHVIAHAIVGCARHRLCTGPGGARTAQAVWARVQPGPCRRAYSLTRAHMHSAKQPTHLRAPPRSGVHRVALEAYTAQLCEFLHSHPRWQEAYNDRLFYVTLSRTLPQR